MNTRSFIFFTRILARAQISSLIFRGLFYWGFIGHNFGDYKNSNTLSNTSLSVLSVTILETTKTVIDFRCDWKWVLSVTILETTKTNNRNSFGSCRFYRSQFWRLQKQWAKTTCQRICFIGHNFGDYKNSDGKRKARLRVLSVTILETTKTREAENLIVSKFYRSQFWRLQKPSK